MTGRTLSPSDLDEAKRLYARGRHDEGAAAARAWLQEHPDDPKAYHLLGVCYAAMGHARVAVGVLERAVALRPEAARTRASLGVALRAAGDTPGALRELAAARATGKESAYVALESGLLCLCVGAGEEALEHFDAALESQPANRRAQLGLGLAEALAGRAEAGRRRLRDAGQEIHLEAGRLASELERQGRAQDALEIMRLALAIGAEDDELPFRVAAAEGAGGPARAPDAYVEAVFDRFAAGFDSVLVDRLDYRTPEIIVGAARRHVEADGPALSILDGGCGTGLCGPPLRPLASRLDGVDLSGRMLERARERGVYDELVQSELVAFLDGRPRAYDLIVCADVLVYIGDLGELFARAAGALRPGGRLAVSVERFEGERYVLQSSGRFAHADDYLRVVAGESGLVELESLACDLRLERGCPVPGLVAVWAQEGAA